MSNLQARTKYCTLNEQGFVQGVLLRCGDRQNLRVHASVRSQPSDLFRPVSSNNSFGDDLPLEAISGSGYPSARFGRKSTFQQLENKICERRRTGSPIKRITRMLRTPATIMTALLVISSLSGCQYDRSFMNFDSNSGSPFFGLQLAVDSGSRPPKSMTEQKPKVSTSKIHRFEDSETELPFQLQKDHGATGRKLPVEVATQDKGNPSQTIQKTRIGSGFISIVKPTETQDSSSAELVDLRLSAF